MKTYLIKLLVITLVGLAIAPGNCAKAQQFYPTNVTADQASAMDPKALEKLVKNYEQNTNRWSAPDLLPIGIAYAKLGRSKEGERAYLSYLAVKPDDPRANRGIAMVYAGRDDYDKAVDHLEKAKAMGDKQSISLLAALYAGADDTRKLDSMLPELLELRKSESGKVRDNIVNVLALHAVRSDPFNKRLFLQAIEGVTDDEIANNSSTLQAVIIGLRKIGDEKRASELSKRVRQNGKSSPKVNK